MEADCKGLAMWQSVPPSANCGNPRKMAVWIPEAQDGDGPE